MKNLANDPQKILADSSMSVMQVVAVAMCILLNALDGFDVLSISFASPGISSDWGIDRAALGVVLSMELIGMGVGSIILGNIADRFGRRPTILGCLVVMSLGMVAAGQADGITELSVYRLITGLGIGGMLASSNAMAAEFSNLRYRNLAVILFAGGYPLGAVIGGSVASDLLKTYDWRAVFYFGAIITLIFIIFVIFLLPESISFLLKKRPKGALGKVNCILTRMKHENIDTLPHVNIASKTGGGKIFSPTLRRTTLLLSVAYFTHMMTFYFILKWIPKIVADMGYAASAAGGVLVWANIGGILGTVLVGLLSQRYPVRPMLILVLTGGAMMVAFFGQGTESLIKLQLLAAEAVFFTMAAMVCLYALIAQAFPTESRASGTGFAIGFGRGGAALGPIVAGLLFSIGYSLPTIAIFMASGSLIAVAALVFLKPAHTAGDCTQITSPQDMEAKTTEAEAA